MIFPWLRGIYPFHKIPAAWIIVLLNIFVMLLTSSELNIGNQKMSELMDNKFFITVNGTYFSTFVQENPTFYSKTMRSLAEIPAPNDEDRLQLLGRLALRDQRYLDEANSYYFGGDKVAHAFWSRHFNAYLDLQTQHPSFLLGLKASNLSWPQWFSYQFAHSGLVHVMMNMFFLLLFAGMLEPMLGAVGFLVVYLLSGLMAAGAFLLVTGANASPLVGASGAVSGLMAMFCVFYWNRPVRFLYFLFIPLRGYSGFIYLPGWVVFALWFLSDVAGLFGNMPEFGGIAHANHLGGQLAGFIAGALVAGMYKKRGIHFDGGASVKGPAMWSTFEPSSRNLFYQ